MHLCTGSEQAARHYSGLVRNAPLHNTVFVQGRDTEEYLRSEERRMLLASSAVTSIGEKRR